MNNCTSKIKGHLEQSGERNGWDDYQCGGV